MFRKAFPRIHHGIKTISLALVLLAFAGGVTLYLQYREFMATPVAMPPEGRIVTIPGGASALRVTKLLAQHAVIADWRLFYLRLRLGGQARKIKSGDYLFTQRLTPQEVLRMLVRGEVLPREFTIIPGWRVRDMMQALQDYRRVLKLDGAPPATQAQDLLQRMNVSSDYAEGWFYPDTYRFERGASVMSLLSRAHAKMEDVLAAEWANRAANLPLDTPYQGLILASIIEKETGQAKERPLIAAVFTNRLKKRMRLQTDPTVIYGMGEAFNGNISKADLQHLTPYNTYRIAGLPPTPIALPSGAAIHAAFHPAQTNALYFVANGKGEHIFSDNYAAHLAAVQQYQPRLSHE